MSTGWMPSHMAGIDPNGAMSQSHGMYAMGHQSLPQMYYDIDSTIHAPPHSAEHQHISEHQSSMPSQQGQAMVSSQQAQQLGAHDTSSGKWAICWLQPILASDVQLCDKELPLCEDSLAAISLSTSTHHYRVFSSTLQATLMQFITASNAHQLRWVALVLWILMTLYLVLKHTRLRWHLNGRWLTRPSIFLAAQT